MENDFIKIITNDSTEIIIPISSIGYIKKTEKNSALIVLNFQLLNNGKLENVSLETKQPYDSFINQELGFWVESSLEKSSPSDGK